jgi:hypothetical protein
VYLFSGPKSRSAVLTGPLGFPVVWEVVGDAVLISIVVYICNRFNCSGVCIDCNFAGVIIAFNLLNCLINWDVTFQSFVMGKLFSGFFGFKYMDFIAYNYNLSFFYDLIKCILTGRFMICYV